MSPHSNRLLRCSIACILTSTAHAAFAQSDEPATAAAPALERIVVTAQRIDAARVGGSVAFLDSTTAGIIVLVLAILHRLRLLRQDGGTPAYSASSTTR